MHSFYLLSLLCLSSLAMPLKSMDVLMGNESPSTRKKSSLADNSSQALLASSSETLDISPTPVNANNPYKRLVQTTYRACSNDTKGKMLLGTALCCVANMPKDLYVGLWLDGFPLISALSGLVPNLAAFGLCLYIANGALKDAHKKETLESKLKERFIAANSSTVTRAKQLEICNAAKDLGLSDATCKGLAGVGVALGLNALKDVICGYIQIDTSLKTCSLINACMNTSGLFLTIGAGIYALSENNRKTTQFTQLLKELDALVLTEEELA